MGEPCERCRPIRVKVEGKTFAAMSPEGLAAELRAGGIDATSVAGTVLIAASPPRPGEARPINHGAGWQAPGSLMPLSEPPKHSPEGQCPACDWPYCRVREVKPEVTTHCAGCDAPATDRRPDPFRHPDARPRPPDAFHGGGMFLFPINAKADPHARAWEAEQRLCASCGAKVAAFIKHLRDTNGGKK